jgi:hypothetical protein
VLDHIEMTGQQSVDRGSAAVITGPVIRDRRLTQRKESLHRLECKDGGLLICRSPGGCHVQTLRQHLIEFYSRVVRAYPRDTVASGM